VFLGFSMRQTIFYPAPFATRVAENTNHHFGRPIQNRRACLRPLPARASCAPGPGLTDRRSPRDGKAALAGSAACQERVCTVISPSRASLDPSRVVLQQPRANLSILDWECTYGLLNPRWVGPGNTNLTAAACVQQAVYRFCRGLNSNQQNSVPGPGEHTGCHQLHHWGKAQRSGFRMTGRMALGSFGVPAASG
jgi:hypothetical protein